MSRFRHPSLAGKVSQQVQAEKRMADPPDYIPRPLPGMLLKTIRVTDELQGCSFEIKIRQGTRLNQIVAETFGRKSGAHGCSWLTAHLRQKLVTRWMRG